MKHMQGRSTCTVPTCNTCRDAVHSPYAKSLHMQGRSCPFMHIYMQGRGSAAFMSFHMQGRSSPYSISEGGKYTPKVCHYNMVLMFIGYVGLICSIIINYPFMYEPGTLLRIKMPRDNCVVQYNHDCQYDKHWGERGICIEIFYSMPKSLCWLKHCGL